MSLYYKVLFGIFGDFQHLVDFILEHCGEVRSGVDG